ncbi:MAG: hypothetical protein IKD96_01360 [Oscillospiraceae bacterium]|nr:hypothetical protein [Oscillospiraceae bacterium]
MSEVINVRFRGGYKTYFFDPRELTVKPGEDVIVETAKGPELCTCTVGNHEVEPRLVTSPLRPVLRIATEEDKRTAAANRAKEPRAFEICQQKIQEFGLDMKLVRVEYSFDGSKILFFFTSEGRVDFREMVRSLASIFRTRIELRQIGVRDEAKLLGGIGVCGRPFCCSGFLDQFQPVSIKMAKTQNLSLNPAKISGACGRLMCCLKYEQEAYEDLIARAPKADSFVDTPEGTGTIQSLNLLRQQAKVRLDAVPETPKNFRYDEITVIRSGKGKRPEGYDSPEEVRAKRLQQAQEEAKRRRLEEEAARKAAQEALAEQKKSSHSGRGKSAGSKSRSGGAPEEKRPEQSRSQSSRKHGKSSGGRSGGKSGGAPEIKKQEQAKPQSARKPGAVKPSGSGSKSRHRPHRRRGGGHSGGGQTQEKS